MKNLSLARILLYLLTGTITLAVSTTWEVTSRLSHIMEQAMYWVLSLQYFIAAGTVLVLMLVIERRYPRISIKLLQASMTIGICCYFMPAVATFYSMRFMSPAIAALVVSIVPLWLWIYKIGNWRKKAPALAICITAITVFFFAVASGEQITTREIFILIVLFVSSYLYATGITFTRRIFWMHYGLELNFYAMGFAACLLGLLSVLFAENRALPEAQNYVFLVYLSFLSVVVLGAGTFFYRFVAHQPRFITMITFTVGIPLLALLIAWATGATPITFLSVTSAMVVLVTLGFTGVGEQSAAWMTHFLTNTRRVGERVVCKLNGFIKSEKGPLVKIDVNDLSIGGLGFYTDDALQVGNKTLVSIPLGEGWTQLSVEAKIVHAVKIPQPGNPGAFRWHGGLMFINIPEDRLQTLVEFLAGMGHVGET